MAIAYSKAFKRDLTKWILVTVSPEFIEVMFLLQRKHPLPEK